MQMLRQMLLEETINTVSLQCLFAAQSYMDTENYSEEYFIDTKYSKLVAAYIIVHLINLFVSRVRKVETSFSSPLIVFLI